MIRILIVDDEPSARTVLEKLIERHIAGNKEIRSCASPEEALQVINDYNPTLLMLDIEMPHMNGFDLLNKIGHWDFDVIFTTAYDKYAIKAIRFSALDYLLKPIDIIDLQNAINRHIVRKEFKPKQQEQLVGNLISNLKEPDADSFKLALSTMEGLFFFHPKDIIRCEGESNYTRFYFPDRKPLLVSRTMKEFEEILADHNFIRVHKSHIVNKKFIRHLDREDLLWLTDGSNIAVSRRKKEEVMRLLRNG
ncbi:MAG: response regulator transcription factor [Chitinophagaceae bacterium]|nr:response regulator transcription factor [Chitinophagaceae bacterium]